MTLDPVQARVLGALIEKEIVTPENYPLSLNALVNACNQKSSRDPVMELTEEQVQQALHRLEDIGLTATARDSRVAKFEHRARTVLNLRRDETALLCLLLLRGPQTPGELRSRSDRMYSFDGLDAVENTLARLSTAPESPADSSSSEPDFSSTSSASTDPTSTSSASISPTLTSPPSQSPASTGLASTVPASSSPASSGFASQSSLPQRPLVVILPRQPGSREARYAHLLCGPVETAISPAPRSSAAAPSRDSEPAAPPHAEILDRIARLEAEVAELRAAIAELR